MTSEDDTFFEEEEYEEDVEEEEEEDDFPDKEDDEGYDPRYEIDGPSPLAKFADDPWPTTAFLLLVAGFCVVFAPSILWAGVNRYFLIAIYVLIILCGAAMAFSIVIWENARGSRLRYAGLTNFVVVVISGVIGTADSISWVVNFQSIIPGITSPLISLVMVLVVFSIYTLWIIGKNFSGPRR
ncbi:MAG: hypothetical protein RTV41_07870 [Candidatus Thorarchaeota archaeon]